MRNPIFLDISRMKLSNDIVQPLFSYQLGTIVDTDYSIHKEVYSKSRFSNKLLFSLPLIISTMFMWLPNWMSPYSSNDAPMWLDITTIVVILLGLLFLFCYTGNKVFFNKSVHIFGFSTLIMFLSNVELISVFGFENFFNSLSTVLAFVNVNVIYLFVLLGIFLKSCYKTNTDLVSDILSISSVCISVISVINLVFTNPVINFLETDNINYLILPILALILVVSFSCLFKFTKKLMFPALYGNDPAYDIEKKILALDSTVIFASLVCLASVCNAKESISLVDNKIVYLLFLLFIIPFSLFGFLLVSIKFGTKIPAKYLKILCITVLVLLPLSFLLFDALYKFLPYLLSAKPVEGVSNMARSIYITVARAAEFLFIFLTQILIKDVLLLEKKDRRIINGIRTLFQVSHVVFLLAV